MHSARAQSSMGRRGVGYVVLAGWAALNAAACNGGDGSEAGAGRAVAPGVASSGGAAGGSVSPGAAASGGVATIGGADGPEATDSALGGVVEPGASAAVGGSALVGRDAGSGGASGDASAGFVAPLVQPIARGNARYVLEFGDLFFELDASVGARAVSLRLGASNNLFTGPADDPDNYGSTFRTSPQSAWSSSGWPPPPEIDVQPYAASVTADGVVAVGTPSSAVGVAVTKTFSADRAQQAIVAAYTLRSTAAGTRVAPWEVTRVAPGGLTFYPTGELPASAGAFALPATQIAADCTWFEYPASVASSQRLIADGKEGWIAHVTADGVLLIKKYPDISAAAQAPGEGEISIYVDGAGHFVELEQQGEYLPLPEGETTTWAVTWYVRTLPAGIAATLGNPALVDFVRSVIQ